MQNERLDLPELEEVKSTGDLDRLMSSLLGPFVFAILAVIALAFIWSSSYPGYGPQEALMWKYLLTAFTAGVVVAVAFQVMRGHWLDYSWATDNDGLTFWRGMFYSRKIRWSEVTRAETKWVNLFMGRRHIIYGQGLSTAIPANQPLLSASVWQHLNRFGKAESVELSEDAVSLWAPMYEHFPESAEWESSSRMNVALLLVMISAMISAYGLIASKMMSLGGKWMVLLITGAVTGIVVDALWSIGWVKADPKKLQTRTRWRTSSVEWNKIESVRWENGCLALNIRITWYRTLQIPWNHDDPDSNALMLCVVRHLRSRENPILLPLPDRLRPETD